MSNENKDTEVKNLHYEGIDGDHLKMKKVNKFYKSLLIKWLLNHITV